MTSNYIQLQNSTPNYTVPKNTFLTFDATPIVTSEDILYISPAGMILLQTPGIYVVKWEVYAIYPSEIQLGLSTSSQGIITSSGSPNEVIGSALIIVTESSAVTLQLLNLSDDTIVCSNGSVAANLIVYTHNPDDVDDDNGNDNGNDNQNTTTETTNVVFEFYNGAQTCFSGLGANGSLASISVIGTIESNITPLTFPVSGETIFQLPLDLEHEYYVYTFPYKVRIVGISAVFNNQESFSLLLPTTNISPFVAIAKEAIPNTYVFDILEETKTYPNSGFQTPSGTSPSISNSTVLTAKKTDLNVEIQAGEFFTIVNGFINLGLSWQVFAQYINLHGTILFEMIEE